MKFILQYMIWWYVLIPLNYDNKWGLIFRLGSFWIGCHYSPYNKRFCLNIIPGITLWWILNDGNKPN